MDDVILFENAIDAALAMAHPWRDRSIVKIVTVYRQELRTHGWGVAFVSEEDIARRTGLSRTTVARYVGDGEGKGVAWRTMWVLERCLPGEGSRPAGFRLRHPAIWRGLHWLEESREVRVARLGSPFHVPYQTTNDDLIAQFLGARASQLAARSLAGRQKEAKRALSHSQYLCDNETVRRAIFDWATKEFGGAPSALAEDGPAGAADAPGEVSDAPEIDAPSSALSEQQQPTATSVLKLVAAINRRGNGRVSAKSLKARLHRVAAAVGEDDLLDAVDLAPTHLQPPLVVALLEEIARGEVTVDELRPDATDARAAEVAQLQAIRAKALRLAATCDEIGDPESAAKHRTEAAECDNRLHQLSSTGEVA